MTEFTNSNPTSYNYVTDVECLNNLLDKLTEKRFVTAKLVVDTVRAACDLHGITLPKLNVEGVDGVTPLDGPFIEAGVESPEDPVMYAPPVEGEWVFNITKSLDLKPMDKYLYIVIDLDEENLFEAYAQIVDGEELELLMDMDAYAKDYPELVGDDSGETAYERQVRKTKDDDES